jgi:hypothetical protein
MQHPHHTLPSVDPVDFAIFSTHTIRDSNAPRAAFERAWSMNTAQPKTTYRRTDPLGTVAGSFTAHVWLFPNYSFAHLLTFHGTHQTNGSTIHRRQGASQAARYQGIAFFS